MHFSQIWALLCIAALGAAPSRPVSVSRAPYDVGRTSAPQLFAENIVSTEDDEGGGTFSPDGTEFYFTKVDQYTNFPHLGLICVSRFRAGQWSKPEVVAFSGQYLEAEDLGADFNGSTTATFEVFVAPDETFLLLGAFGREDSLGSSDLYISYNVNGKWTKPKNLGPTINTRARDYSPRVSGDGKWLLFTSETGMMTEPRSTPVSYDEFVKASRGLYNGLGNLYRVPMEVVLRDTRP